MDQTRVRGAGLSAEKPVRKDCTPPFAISVIFFCLKITDFFIFYCAIVIFDERCDLISIKRRIFTFSDENVLPLSRHQFQIQILPTIRINVQQNKLVRRPVRNG